MNFLELYEETYKNTEPPKNFHLWSALSVVSVLLGRKVYVPMGHYEVFPNLYVCLVGNAGSRKSTAKNQAFDLLSKIKGFPLGPDAVTRESLIESIEESKQWYTLGDKRLFYHQIACVNDEFQEFIGQKHINAAVISFMISIYSSKRYQYRTKNAGQNYIPLPYVNLLTCCVPQWIKTRLKNDMISDGFGRRIIFVYEKHRENYVSRPQLNSEIEVNITMLENFVERFKSMKGVVRFTKEAWDLWDTIYVDIQKNLDKQHPKMQSYYGTKHDLIQKLCMILSACFRDDLVVDTKILEMADKILAKTEVGAEELVTGIGRNELSLYHEEVSNFIANRGIVDLKELTQKFVSDLKQAEFQEVMSVLVDTEKVELVGTSYKSLCKVNESERSNLFELVRGYEPTDEVAEGSDEVEFRRLEL